MLASTQQKIIRTWKWNKGVTHRNRMFLVSILQIAHLWANTGVVFRELSYSRLECGVHDRLHIYPLCVIFYFPWHRHQIEGTNGFYCLIRKTERFTISNVERARFLHLIILASHGD